MIECTSNDRELVESYGLEESSVFRYGSRSDGEKVEGSMVDHIFCVPSTRDFHERNLREHPSDYSTIAKLFGLDFIEMLQRRGANIFYHPFVKFGDDVIKYGVIQEANLIRDLIEWSSLYCAGRFHKPMQGIRVTSGIQTATRKNLEHALNTALLLLPEEFSEEELFLMISKLSYMGDTRMKHGEDPDKPNKLVRDNIDEFRALYSEALKNHKGNHISSDPSGRMQQDISPEAQELLFNDLPLNILSEISRPTSFEQRGENAQVIIKRMSSIVRRSSIQQSLIGFFSAGIRRTIRYIKAKREKRRLSFQKSNQ